MNSTVAFRVASGIGFLGVALGAFGAHGLKELLARHEATTVWQTAVLYHLVHGVVMFAMSGMTPFRRGPWMAFLVGVILFSGSLYAMALTGIKAFGPITPLGGVAFLVGWAWLALGRRER